MDEQLDDGSDSRAAKRRQPKEKHRGGGWLGCPKIVDHVRRQFGSTRLDTLDHVQVLF